MGDRSAPIGPDRRDTGVDQQMFGLAGLAQRQYGPVLAAPELIRGLFDPPGRERGHLPPCLLVIDPPEIANDLCDAVMSGALRGRVPDRTPRARSLENRRRGCTHSTILTNG